VFGYEWKQVIIINQFQLLMVQRGRHIMSSIRNHRRILVDNSIQLAYCHLVIAPLYITIAVRCLAQT